MIPPLSRLPGGCAAPSETACRGVVGPGRHGARGRACGRGDLQCVDALRLTWSCPTVLGRMSSLRESLSRGGTASRTCAVALTAGVVASCVLSVLTPSLLAHHAMLLEALSGNVASVVVGGAEARAGRSSLLLVVLAPLLGIVLYDLALWWAGRLWGNQVLSRVVRTPRARRRLLQTEARVARRGVLVLAAAYFLPLPNPATYLLCGASGMPVLVFVLGDLVGTLLWTGTLAALGWAAGRPVLLVLHAIDRYALGVTVVGVVIAALVTRRRASSRLREVPTRDVP